MVALSCISSSSAILSLSANLSLRKKMYTAPKQLFYTASRKQKMYTASQLDVSMLGAELQLFYTASRKQKMYIQQPDKVFYTASLFSLGSFRVDNTKKAYLLWLTPHSWSMPLIQSGSSAVFFFRERTLSVTIYCSIHVRVHNLHTRSLSHHWWCSCDNNSELCF